MKSTKTTPQISLPKLNLPGSDKLRLKQTADGECRIWDSLRRKWLVATPEEWVRQNFISLLVEHLGYNPLHIRQEYPVAVGVLDQRADIVVCAESGQPLMLVECKSTDITLSNATLDQAVRYNATIKAPYIVLTNGIKHFCFRHNATEPGKYQPVETIPSADNVFLK